MSSKNKVRILLDNSDNDHIYIKTSYGNESFGTHSRYPRKDGALDNAKIDCFDIYSTLSKQGIHVTIQSKSLW